MEPLTSGVVGTFDPDSRQAFLAIAVPVPLRAGNLLMTQDDDADRVVLVGGGLTEVVLVGADGREMFRTFRGPGSLLGEFGVIAEQPRCATVRVLADGHGRVVEARRLKAFLRDRPDVHSALLGSVLAKFTQGTARDARYYDGSQLGRVARVLVDHLDRFGPPPGRRIGELPIDVPLTYQRVGDLVGESASFVEKRVLDLKRKGILRTAHRSTRHRIRILDRAALLAEAAQ